MCTAVRRLVTRVSVIARAARFKGFVWVVWVVKIIYHLAARLVCCAKVFVSVWLAGCAMFTFNSYSPFSDENFGAGVAAISRIACLTHLPHP